MLDNRWLTVFYVDPTLIQHWLIVKPTLVERLVFGGYIHVSSSESESQTFLITSQLELHTPY